MLLSLAYTLARFLAELCLVRIRSNLQLRAEVLALRHQLRVLERKLGKPRWQPGDRLVLASLSRLLPRSAWSALLPSPATLPRGSATSSDANGPPIAGRPPRRRRPPDLELRGLILRLARENSGFGYRRIQGEALKLGFQISHMGVANILRQHRMPPAPAQPTLLEGVRPPARRPDPGHRLLRGRHCLAAWVVQQARNLAWRLQEGGLAAKFLIRDRDSKFAAAFDQVFRSEGVEVIQLPYRRPVAKAYASHC